MKKHRICIVGDGLAGLMSALALNSLPSLEVHLISKKNKLKKANKKKNMESDFFKWN